MRVYLDACCLNRPFDDQRADRIRVESEAIVLIMNHLDARDWTWVGSEVPVATSSGSESVSRIPSRG